MVDSVASIASFFNKTQNKVVLKLFIEFKGLGTESAVSYTDFLRQKLEIS